MPKGQPIPLEDIYDILVDSARVGVDEAAKAYCQRVGDEEALSSKTIYGWRSKWPKDWKEAQQSVQAIVEKDTEYTWALASSRLVKMLEDPEQEFKPAVLANILRNCSINFKRFLEMGNMEIQLNEMIEKLLEAINKGYYNAFDAFKIVADMLSDEQCDRILEYVRSKDGRASDGAEGARLDVESPGPD